MSNKDYLKQVGMEIKVARIRKGISRNELAKLTGLNITIFSKVENGLADSHILTYKRIADALGTELKDIL